jgi:hypothetical protein
MFSNGLRAYMRVPQGRPAPPRMAGCRAAHHIPVERRCAAPMRLKVIMLARFLRRRRTRRYAWWKSLDFTHPRVTAALVLFHRHV